MLLEKGMNALVDAGNGGVPVLVRLCDSVTTCPKSGKSSTDIFSPVLVKKKKLSLHS